MTAKTYVALLRGINVGGRTLTMADLLAAVAGLGFAGTRTYLQSGNLVFQTEAGNNSDLADQIAAVIRSTCAMSVHVMVRTAEEWNAIIAANPYTSATEKPKTLHVFVFDQMPVQARIDGLDAQDFGTEEWAIVKNALYLHTPDGFGKSKLGKGIERALKVPMTARNWNSVIALAEMVRSG